MYQKVVKIAKSRIPSFGIAGLGVMLEDGTTIIDNDQGSGELPSISIQIMMIEEFEPFIVQTNTAGKYTGEYILNVPGSVYRQLEINNYWSK